MKILFAFNLSLLIASQALARPCGPETPSIVDTAMKSAVQISFCERVNEEVANGWQTGWLRENEGASIRDAGMAWSEFSQGLPTSADGEQIICGAIGSGVLISADQVITNAHVVNNAENVGEIRVTLNDGRLFIGDLVGHSNNLDLAAINLRVPEGGQVTNENVQVATFGRSADLFIGDDIIAIGQPLGLDRTVSFLNVSHMNRVRGSRNRYLQLDGAINQGNSGGPAFNCQGEVIGINAAIISNNGGGSIGIGLTIPSEVVISLGPTLLAEEGEFQGTVLGVNLMQSDADAFNPAHVSIRAIADPMGLGARLGLQEGDIFVSINGVGVDGNLPLVPALLAEIPEGQSFPFEVEREGQILTVDGHRNDLVNSPVLLGSN